MENVNKVSLVVCGKIPGVGWRRGSLSTHYNKAKPGLMIHGGKEVAPEQWHFEIRHYVDAVAKYKNVGNNLDAANEIMKHFTTAVELRDRVIEARAAGSGLEAGVRRSTIKAPMITEDSIREFDAQISKFGIPPIIQPPAPKIEETPLTELKKTFLQKYAHGSTDTVALYTVVADEFVNEILKGKTQPVEIKESDVIKYDRTLEARGMAKTTRSNRYVTLRCFLRHVGLDPVKLVDAATNKKLKAKPVTIPEIYTPEELEKLIAVSSEYNALAWTCFAQLGFRDEELATLRWDDISWEEKTVSVRYKADINWKPKDAEERDVPCSDSLLAKLKAWHDDHPKTRYVLGTASDKPNNKFLQTLKRDWKRAGLNCAVCGGCTKIINVKRKSGTKPRTQDQCERAYLHKFRATYLTRMLNFCSPADVQRLAGHSSLETTQRYLRAASNKQLQGAVNLAFEK